MNDLTRWKEKSKYGHCYWKYRSKHFNSDIYDDGSGFIEFKGKNIYRQDYQYLVQESGTLSDMIDNVELTIKVKKHQIEELKKGLSILKTLKREKYDNDKK